MVTTNITSKKRQTTRVGAALALALIAISACGSKETSDGFETGALVEICPQVIKIQTDWFPEAEHGGVYQLLGDDYEIKKDSASVRGSLMNRNTDTGIDVEIFAGGEFTGGRSVSAVMYDDDTMTFGFINTDSSVRDSADTPTVSVFAPLSKSPLGFMWDAKKHPGVETLADALEEIDTVSVFGRLAFVEYLVAEGLIPESKLDLNYKGDLQIATRDVIHQGFGTTEPYQYMDQFGIEVAFESLYDLGWPIYPETLAVRADQLEALSGCLEQLVPILQTAQIDFMKNPARTVDLIVETNETYDSWWQYDRDLGLFSVEQQIERGIVSSGSGTFGAMDETRVQKIIDAAAPIFRNLGKDVPETLAVDDLINNSFLDPNIEND